MKTPELPIKSNDRVSADKNVKDDIYSIHVKTFHTGGFIMLPIGPLMIEHRLIGKMITVIRREVDKAESKGSIDPAFIDTAVDFMRTYADKCHHGKEEDIFFRDLNKKDLPHELKVILSELIEEHKKGRQVVSNLVEAKLRYVRGEKEALSSILDDLRNLTVFYPRHIEKEDRHFFIPCMNYFTEEEKDQMLKEEWEFDKNLIHQIYKAKVSEREN
jgi:hemerythrin-like domain-containing protein